jgi:hypothetical protein
MLAPRIWLVSFSAKAMPAASTAALEVRLPLDNWFMARVIERSLLSSALLAYIDWTLVLITEDMFIFLYEEIAEGLK